MADVEQDGSSRSSSRGSSFSLCHMSESAYAKVVFCEIHDSYPADTDVVCSYQLSESVVPHPDDYIGLFRVGWHELEKCIALVSCASATQNSSIAGDSYKKVDFKAIDLPKDDFEYYQFLYKTKDNEICGASTPFKFHTVHEDENVVVLSAEHDFLEVKSSSSYLHTRLAETQQYIAFLEKAKRELEAKMGKTAKENDEMKKNMEEANSARQKEFETKLDDCLAAIVQGSQVLPELPECSENVQTMIYSLKALVDRITRNNTSLKTKNAELLRDLAKAKGDFDAYKVKELQATMQNTALADTVKISLQQLTKENVELKEERCALQKVLSDTKDLFRASEECKSLVHQELENVKKSKDEMAASMDDLKLLNTLLKKQLANNENAIKEMENVWRELEDVKANFDTEKEAWIKQRTELEEQVSDLTVRLKEAAELYKKQFLEIRGLKKHHKSHESSKQKHVNGGPADATEERVSYSSSDSNRSLEGPRNPSCMTESLISLSDSDSVEHIVKKEENKQCEAVPDSKPANSSTNCLTWSSSSSVAEFTIGKPSAPVEEENGSNRVANSTTNTPAAISFAALRELMIVDSANSNKVVSIGSTEGTSSRNEIPQHHNTQSNSYPSVASSGGSEEVKIVYEFSPEMYDLPCPLCEEMIKVYAHNTTQMDDHLLDVHNQQLCPVCGRMFDKGLPSNYFKYHVENHFSEAQSTQ